MIPDVLVPKSLLEDAAAFGGRDDGECVRGDLVLGEKGPVLRAGAATNQPRYLIPALVEAHCHLDKCHTIGRLGAVGGDLPEAIKRQEQEKAEWTSDDIRRRVLRGLGEARAAGCRLIRSHVDWSSDKTPPQAWPVMREIGADDLQLSAFAGIDQLSDPDFAGSVAREAARASAALGAFVLGHGETEAGLAEMFRVAERFGLPVDFHVDETQGDANGLEMIANAALAAGFEGPILCGHAVSLFDRSPEHFDRIADKLARAGITICALPWTNLYLQGRSGSATPDRRGLTRLAELDRAGVPVCVGSDNVGDAFCPVGAFDPMRALALGVVGAHLDPPFEHWLPLITTNAARALGHAPGYVDRLPPHQLLLFETGNAADVISSRVRFQTLSEVYA